MAPRHRRREERRARPLDGGDPDRRFGLVAGAAGAEREKVELDAGGSVVVDCGAGGSSQRKPPTSLAPSSFAAWVWSSGQSTLER